DRPGLVRPADRAGVGAVRERRPRVEVPGSARADSQQVLEELRGVVKVLLTGGTGFVGTRVADVLRAQERDVRCLVRDPSRAQTLRSWDCELVPGDMTDEGSLR